MCGDLGFYASELIHAIRGLKEQGTFDTIVDVVGAFGPVIISGIALWISWRSSKNTDAIQRQIATAEKRSLLRQELVDTFTIFVDETTFDHFDKGYYRIPEVAFKELLENNAHRIHLQREKNKVRMLIGGESSVEAKELIFAVENAYEKYELFYYRLERFINSKDYRATIENAKLNIYTKYGQIPDTQIYWNKDIEELYNKLTDHESYKEIAQLIKAYKESTNDENFDVYFQKYLNTLSK